MNNPASALDNWQALYNLSLTMLKHARSGLWTSLITFEISYVQLVEISPKTLFRGTSVPD